MKAGLVLFTAVVALLVLPGAARQPKPHTPPDPLARVAPLLGNWTGISDGEPGTAATTRRATRAHGNRYIMVEGRSVYPKQEKNPKGEIHTQTDVWSYDKQRKVLVLRQFDNLGFVSTYAQDVPASAAKRIVMVSEQLENVPAGWKARYTFEFPAADEYRELFELDTDGLGFKPYVTGRFLRARR